MDVIIKGGYKMNAEIFSIGTELLMGQISNTNAQFLSRNLSELGINVYYHSVVGDNMVRASDLFKIALERSDLIVTTGGLGPTQDDLTKEMIANTLNLEMVLDESSLEKIKLMFKRYNKSMSKSNKKQAYFPMGSIILENPTGTAPGCIIETNGKTIIVLPGPPNELIPMFNEKVFPYLKKLRNKLIKSSFIKVFGIGEAKIEEILMELIDNQTNPTIATYGGEGDVLVRVTASGDTETIINDLLLEFNTKISHLLGDYIYSYNDLKLEEVVGGKLIELNKTIALAESCTGGLASAFLTKVPGISQIFINSYITYCNTSKEKLLGVRNSTLKKHGAVSKETALEMARGARLKSETNIGVSITGIAGPDGGTDEKPVGLVYVGFSTYDVEKTFKFNLFGNRERIRLLAVMNVLDILRRYLIKGKEYFNHL